ncbi:MAG: hypothetical protein FD123_645 [Bacteroidetes bacterium]|nr:MAG: hypothetical protein FD123_645 [Bacteroidota bacterium]
MFENRTHPVITHRAYLRRLVRNFLISSLIIFFALAIGTIGYHATCPMMSWIDAFYNASMILTGMGPAEPMPTDAAKLFASFYALFSGVIFLGTITIVIAPVIHRLLHTFHMDEND